MISRLIALVSQKAVARGPGTQITKPEQIAPGRRQSDAQLRYLSHATFLEEAGTPHYLNGIALACCLCVATFVGWAALTRIAEVSHSPGEIVPSGFEQVVQHLDGGIVRRIEVKPGDLVEKGQLLLALDDGSTAENLERAHAKLVHLQLTAVRLRALFEGTTPGWSTVEGARPEDIRNQANLYQSAIDDQVGREKIVLEQIEQKKSAASILEDQLATGRKNKVLSKNILNARSELFAKNLVSYPVFARAQLDYNKADGDVSQLEDQIKQNERALVELDHRLEAIRRASRLQASDSLNETVSEIRQIKATIEALVKKFERLELRSPVRGLVKSVDLNTIGGVLPAGLTVATIVPVEEDLVAELRVSPRDIGHVRVGQPVNVKFSAFDFSRYGVVSGTLEHISASSFNDRTGQTYYRARARLSADHLGSDGDKNRILPGMTVMANIQTGDKTVLDYLLKPVKAMAVTAFNER